MPTLLVAEDDPHIRRVLEVTLRRQGFDVTAVPDGAEAVEALQARLYDVVLVDGMMPRMDGIDVCRHVRADPRTAHIPVIMLSARTSMTDERTVRAAGATDFIRKPFDALQLGAAIRRACGAGE
jgi:CheY-like chemotaxis protein